MNDSGTWVGYALTALSACCFGFMPVFARIAYASGCDTSTLLLIRFSLGGLFLAAISAAKHAALPPRPTWPVLFLLGFFGYTGTSFCYFTALKYASASLVSLLLYTYPALVTLFSLVFTGERPTLSTLASLVCALSGCVLVIGLDGQGEPKGVALALTAALVYSLYIIISSRIVGKKTAMASSASIILSSSVAYGLMSAITGTLQLPKTLSGVAAVIAIALLSTVIAFWSFFAGMGRIGATKASLVSTLEPLVTVLSALLFLGERLAFSPLAGGFLIIAALVVSGLEGVLKAKYGRLSEPRASENTR